MRRTSTLIWILTLAFTVPVFAQEAAKGGSFWDTPREPAKAATTPAKAGAKAPANSVKPASSASRPTTAIAEAAAPKSFWDTKPEARAWTGWNGSPSATPTSASAKSLEPAVTKASETRMAAVVTAAPPVAKAMKPKTPSYAASGSRKAAKPRGVTLSFPDLVEKPAVDMASLAPSIENGAPAALGVAVDPEPQPPQIAPPSSVPQPAAPRLPGAAPSKSPTTPWLKVTGQYRGRVEDWNTGFAVADSYYLNRLRMQAEVTPANWFRAVVQVQDARTADYSLKVAPTGMYNQLDVRLGFVDVKHKQSGTTFRGGRQEFNFGEGRLVSAADWGNVGRSFDGGSVQWARKQGLLTVFAASVVVIDSKGVDELKHGEQFYGGLYTWTSKKTKRVFEPYVFVKSQDRAIDERGNVGDALVTTLGVRAVGPITKRFDYNVETAYQAGHYAQDDHRAWAVHFGGGTTFGGGWKPRIGVDYDAASGDGTAKDGSRNTFDVLYGANHAKFGLVDNIAWRNMEHVGVVFTASPAKEIKVTSGWHRSWIRDLRDGYYPGAGSKAKTKATTENLFGDTVDLQVGVDLTKHVSVLFGTGYMFAGPYQVLGVGRDNAFHQFFLWKVVF